MTVVKRLLPWISIAAVLPVVALFSSCIKDNRDDCLDEPLPLLLYVKIVDAENGRDITAASGAEGAILTLFDRDGGFVASRLWNGGEIVRREPWTVYVTDARGMQVPAWAGPGGMEISDPQGAAPGEPFVQLPVDDEGFSPSPGELFFGMRVLDPRVAGRMLTDEVVLTHKNAKVHVTVKGLGEPDTDRYYFVIETPGNGYDLYGHPGGQRAKTRHAGRFDASGDFITPGPSLAVHSADPDNPGPRDGAAVYLYRRDGGGDTALAVATLTDTGGYIGLFPGKTTNILIDLRGPASLSVRVDVTGWNEVYLWDQW